MFCVRSAYKFFKSLRSKRVEGESSTNSKLKQLWKGIWRLKTPYKVKLFAWRVCIEGLLIKSNLERRRVVE